MQHIGTCDLSDSDIQQLLNARLIEQCDRPMPTTGLHIFAVPEHAKKRRRLICHTIDTNTYSQPTTFPSTRFHTIFEELFKIHLSRDVNMDMSGQLTLHRAIISTRLTLPPGNISVFPQHLAAGPVSAQLPQANATVCSERS